MSPQARETREWVNKWTISSWEVGAQYKKPPTSSGNYLLEWEKMFTSDASAQGLMFKMYKEQINSAPKIIIIANPIKNGQGTWKDTFPRRTYRWPIYIWNYAHQRNKTYNQHGNHFTPARVAILLNQQTISVSEELEKREPSCIVNGNVHWCQHYEKQCGGFSKN